MGRHIMAKQNYPEMKMDQPWQWKSTHPPNVESEANEKPGDNHVEEPPFSMLVHDA